jgi:hypothetical protein
VKTDRLLNWLAAGDKNEAEKGVGHAFCIAMIYAAVLDIPRYRTASAWLRGELDPELEAICRASTCFEVAGINQAEALRALGLA